MKKLERRRKRKKVKKNPHLPDSLSVPAGINVARSDLVVRRRSVSEEKTKLDSSR